MTKEKISIIVPCYNEEDSLPIFYKEINKISKEMDEVNFEFLFINDACCCASALYSPAAFILMTWINVPDFSSAFY